MAMAEADSARGEALDLLTPRERECLRLVYEHMSSKEIGRRLGISKHTVDTHVDKARQRLGALDRYDAARRVVAHDRAMGIPTPSGPDTIGIGAVVQIGLAPPRTGDASSEPIEQDQSFQDRDPGPGPAPGGGRLRADMAGAALSGDGDAAVHLGAARAATGGSFGFAQPGGDHRASGFRPAQAVQVEAAGNGAARDPLSRLDPDGRSLPAWPVAGGGHGHALGPFAKLGLILLIAAASAVAFAGVVASLHALKGLV